MSIDLEDGWEVTSPTLMVHLWDTINVLGGVKGLAVMVFVMYLFYSTVEWYIARGRAQRRQQKRS